ncbi:MAG: hypothetical protein UX89_C0013G0006 [Parcubacteria group bacterium GW2011_GWA2_47_16]|nr:MAG: hypothetical protein UX89_C0013G0006 [Parcubacteria group bacterium GW2011_GWA2_47_16]
MISDELVKFVREQLTNNVPKEQIAAILKPGGWTDADVAEAIGAVHFVPKPPVSAPPVFQPTATGTVASVGTVTPTQNPLGQQSQPANPIFNPANPTGVQTQFQTAFRLQTMPAMPSSGKKWPIIIVLILFALLIAGAGVWYFLYRQPASVTVAPPQEQLLVPETEAPLSVEAPAPVVSLGQDLLTAWTKIPDEQNSAAAISAAGALITKADSDILNKYFGKGYDVKNFPPIATANAVAGRNVKTLQAFSAALAAPSYQCSILMTPQQCNYQPVRNIGRLLLLRSYVLEKAGKMLEALSIASNIVDIGKKISAEADDAVPILIGWNLQKDGYQRISSLNPKLSAPFVISADEKPSLVSVLRDEHKNVFKIAYTRQAEFLEYLTDKNKVPSFPLNAEELAVAEEYRKSITLGKFNLEETKKYFYDSYKTQIGNVDLACGSLMAKAPYDFSAEVNTATTTSNQTSIENYVGKILYWTTYTSFDSLNAKRCEVETLINKL